MKLNNLTIQGNNREKAIDFGNKVAGAVIVADTDIELVRDSLAFVFYGAGAEAFKGAEARLSFTVEDGDYLLSRSVQELPDGGEKESVLLTSSDGKTVYADDAEGVNAFVAEKVGLDAGGFMKLAVMDRELTAPLTADTVTRESFVAEMMADFATSEKVMAKYSAMKQQEAALLEEIEAVAPVTRDELRQQQMVAESDRIALDAVRADLDAVGLELQFAEKYREELNDYNEALEKLDKLAARNNEMADLASRAANSDAASNLSKVFTVYDASKAALQREAEEIKAAEAAQQERVDRVKAGESSLNAVSKDYMAAAIRCDELGKAIIDELKSLSDDPKSFKMGKLVDSYYAGYEPRKQELTKESENLTKELAALDERSKEIRDRMSEIRVSADYKRAVQEGAVYEESLARLTVESEDSSKRTEQLEQQLTELKEKRNEVGAALKTAQKDLDAVKKDICGEHACVEDAVNAQVYYKQTIYYKHLFVSDNEVELKAVEDKIEKVKYASDAYSERLKKMRANSDEVKAHKAKLEEKLHLLNEKLTEYMSYNRLREIASTVEYGSHCPVCDGFVTYKKELPIRDTKALDDRIKAVENEIKKDADAISAAESNIGQLAAATKVSAEYLENLMAVKAAKQKAIDDVLAEYSVDSIAALFALVDKAVKDGNALTIKVDRYRKLSGEVECMGKEVAFIDAEIKRIGSELLPAESQKRSDIANEVSEIEKLYLACNVHFNGESAGDLLKKLEVIEEEYEKLADELEANRTHAAMLADTLSNVNSELFAIVNRTVPVTVDGKELEYKEAVAKAEADYLKALIDEYEGAKEAKENAKVFIRATRTVVDEARKAADDGDKELIAMRARHAGSEQIHNELYANYIPQFEAIGLHTLADIDRLVMSEEEIKEARETLFKYDEDVVGTKEAVNVYKQGIDEHVGYYDNYDNNIMRRDALKKEEDAAIMKLGASISLRADMEERYNKLVSLNKQLAYLQARLKGIDDLSAAIKEGAILASDLAELIAARLDETVRYISQNRYATARDDSGAVRLVLTAGKGRIRYDKPTKEEAMLLPLASAAAFFEVMSALLAGDIVPLIQVSVAECDKQSLSPLVEYAKEHDIVVFPDDDAIFFRAVSKINI